MAAAGPKRGESRPCDLTRLCLSRVLPLCQPVTDLVADDGRPRIAGSMPGVTVRRGEGEDRGALVVRVRFEPSRLARDCLTAAYEQVAPVRRRPIEGMAQGEDAAHRGVIRPNEAQAPAC
jgi:hypothetical protein